MTTKAPASNNGFKVIGTTPIRHDATDKVTGQARYGADMTLPGLLYGKILRSPYAHAKIRSIDATKALALPGVKAVVGGPQTCRSSLADQWTWLRAPR